MILAAWFMLVWTYFLDNRPVRCQSPCIYEEKNGVVISSRGYVDVENVHFERCKPTPGEIRNRTKFQAAHKQIEGGK